MTVDSGKPHYKLFWWETHTCKQQEAWQRLMSCCYGSVLVLGWALTDLGDRRWEGLRPSTF
jgi:hypothetical protein